MVKTTFKNLFYVLNSYVFYELFEPLWVLAMKTYIADWVACRPRTIFDQLLVEIFLLLLILTF